MMIKYNIFIYKYIFYKYLPAPGQETDRMEICNKELAKYYCESTCYI